MALGVMTRSAIDASISHNKATVAKPSIPIKDAANVGWSVRQLSRHSRITQLREKLTRVSTTGVLINIEDDDEMNLCAPVP